MRPSSPSFSVPKADEMAALIRTTPPLRFTRHDLEYHVRGLMQLYPESQLQFVTLIHTDCPTFARAARAGYVAILRLDDGHLLLALLDGPTGFESRYLDAVETRMRPPGRKAGAHAPGHPAAGTRATSRARPCVRHSSSSAMRSRTARPSRLPRPLTDQERAARLELAKQRFIESLRQTPLDC